MVISDGELVGDQTGRGHSDEDESNLSLFLAVALDVKVRQLRLWTQVIKADFFPGELRIQPHGLVDIPKCFQDVALTAKILGDPIQALSPFSLIKPHARPVTARSLYSVAFAPHRRQSS